MSKAYEAAAAREAARKAREFTRRKGVLDIASLLKTSGLSATDLLSRIIFSEYPLVVLLTGELRNQAILPLRGKILNVERKNG